MGDSRAGQSKEFKLDTSSMDKAAEDCQKLAEKMGDVKENIDKLKKNLDFEWQGEGQKAFAKQFRLLKKQLTDVGDELWQEGENILTAEESYIQADTDAAKQLD